MRRSVARLAVKGWRYERSGLPGDVLKLAEYPETQAAEGQVQVKVLAAPVLPQDVQLVTGTYGGVKAARYPAAGGTEGFGEVVAVGQGVRSVKKGAKVLLADDLAGSWQTEVTLEEGAVVAVDAPLAADKAAVLPLYVAGEALAQHFGDVAGKQCLVLGADLPAAAPLAAALSARGAKVTTAATADTTVSTSADFIFNGVGGQLLAAAVEKANESAKVVSFDNASGSQFEVDALLLVTKSITMQSFWYRRWLRAASPEERAEAVERAVAAVQKTAVKTKVYPFAQFEKAFDAVYDRKEIPVVSM